MSEKPPPPYPIRGYLPGDEEEILKLFWRSYRRKTTRAQWDWKMKGMPTEVENVWLARDGEKLIFQYAGLPTRYQLPEGEVNTMVSVDTMTDPDYRRQGLLTYVGRYTYEKWKENGVAFIIGLPNEQWGSRTKALGWQKLFRLEWLRLPLRPEAILARQLHLPVLDRVTLISRIWYQILTRKLSSNVKHIEPMTNASDSFDNLWNKFRKNGLISVVRDKEWIRWRYLQAPSHSYQVILAEVRGIPAGYAVYRLEETPHRKAGFIPEILTHPHDRETYLAILHNITHNLFVAGAEAIYTLAVPNTILYKNLEAAGFMRGKYSFSVEMVALQESLPINQMQMAENWWICGGDFDVI